MSDTMKSVMTYLETGVGDLWGRLYDLNRDELTQLFKELDYAIHCECDYGEQRKIYQRTAENLGEFYREDE